MYELCIYVISLNRKFICNNLLYREFHSVGRPLSLSYKKLHFIISKLKLFIPTYNIFEDKI